MGGVLLSIREAGQQMYQQRRADKGRKEPMNRTPDKIVIKPKAKLKEFNPDGKRKVEGDVLFGLVHRKNPFRGIVGPKLKLENRHVRMMGWRKVA